LQKGLGSRSKKMTEENDYKKEDGHGSLGNVQKLVHYSNYGVLSKVLRKTDKQNITLFSMAKGTEMTEHTSTKEGYAYVLEGDGVFNLEGKDIKMVKGVLIYMKKNAVHSLKANKNTSFLLLLT